MQNEILNYLWQASACLVGFYVFYKLVLEKLTFFGWNRAYLLLTACLSLAIPLIELPILESKSQISETTILQSPNQVQTSKTGSDLTKMEAKTEKTSDLRSDFNFKSDRRSDVTTAQTVNFTSFFASPQTKQILLWVYVAGVVFFAFRLLRNLFQIGMLVRRNPKEQQKDYVLVKLSPENTVFSFFRYIFIPENPQVNKHELDIILRHESVHVRQWHSLDILFVELLQVAFWFNPVFYFLKRSWRDLHEYLADSQVVKDENAKNYAQLILRFSTQYSAVPLAHAFVDSQLRKRIVMLIRSRSISPYKWLFGLSLPVVAFFVFLFSLSEKTLTFSKSPFVYEIDGKTEFLNNFQGVEEGKLQIRLKDESLAKYPIEIVVNVVLKNEVMSYLNFKSIADFNKENYDISEFRALGGVDRVLFEFRLPNYSILENIPLEKAEKYHFYTIDFQEDTEKLAYVVPEVGALDENEPLALNLKTHHLQILVQNPIEHTEIDPRLQIMLVRNDMLIDRKSTFPTHFTGKHTFRLLDYPLEELLTKAKKGDKLVVEFVCLPKQGKENVSFYWKDEIEIRELAGDQVVLEKTESDFASPFEPHQLEVSLDGKKIGKELIIDENTKGDLEVRLYAGYKTGFYHNDSIRVGMGLFRKGGAEIDFKDTKSISITAYDTKATQNILAWLKRSRTGDQFSVFAFSKMLGMVGFPTALDEKMTKIVRKDLPEKAEIPNE